MEELNDTEALRSLIGKHVLSIDMYPSGLALNFAGNLTLTTGVWKERASFSISKTHPEERA